MIKESIKTSSNSKSKLSATKGQAAYDSNPFTNAFRAFGNFFKFNQNWAIVLIILVVLSGVSDLGLQLIGNVRNMQTTKSEQSQTVSKNYRQEAENDFKEATKPFRRNKDVNQSFDWQIIAAITIIATIAIIAFSFIATAFTALVSGTLSYVALKSQQGQVVSFNDALNTSLQKFSTLYVGMLLAQIKVFAWSLLFIIPGIIAALRYTLLTYVIVDNPKKIGALESHKRVKQITKGRLIEVFGIATAASLIPFVSKIISLNGNAALYRQMQIYSDGDIEKPKVHWLNYLGIVLTIFTLLIIALFGLIFLLTLRK